MTNSGDNPMKKLLLSSAIALTATGALAPVSYTHLTLPTIYSV